MEITTLAFEKELTVTIRGEKVTLIAFKTAEHGNIKFGICAPKQVKVNRQEIYHQKRLKLVE